jgi:hypothetical protein
MLLKCLKRSKFEKIYLKNNCKGKSNDKNK